MSETTPEQVQRCAVCGEDEPDAALLELCFSCNEQFHLNPRNDVEGIDHGDAWIGPTLGVYFYCQSCIDCMDAEERAEMGGPSQPSQPAAPPPPPVRRTRPQRQRRYRRIDRP